MTLRVDIEDSAGNKLGYGPIMSATGWRGTQRLDKAGSFQFSMPLSDPLAALITEDVVLRPYAFVNGAWVEQPGGIVGSLRRRAGTPTMLEVTGDDLLRELAEVIVRPAGLSSIVEIADWSPVTPDYVGTLETGAVATERTTPWSWAMDAGEYLYIGHTSPFNKISIALGASVNAHSGAWTYQYYSGNLNGWYSLADVVDSCMVAGAPLHQSGDITWTMPDDWADTSHDSHILYWVRFRQPSDGGQLDTVTFNAVTVDERIGATIADALTTIMTYAPAGWSVDTTGDADVATERVYMQLSGETVLEALVKLSEQTGRHFRLGAGRQVVWTATATASGVRAINGADPIAVEAHTDLALITALEASTDYYERVNGVYPYGAGQGNARLTIADSTETHAGYTIDKANNHVYWTDRTRPIEIEQQWSDIQPAKDTAAERTLAANSLLQKAVQYLSEHKDPQTQWSATLAHVNLALSPGQTIRVVYREVRDGYVAWDIDRDLYILETTTQIDGSGIRTVALTLSTVQRWARTDGEVLLDLYRKARDAQRRPQTLDVANLRYSALEPGEYGLVGFSEGGKLGPRYLPKHGLYSGWHPADPANANTIVGLDANGEVTALSTAPPGAHAATHVTGGGDTIADAVASGASGLMSGADKTLLDTLVAGTGIAARVYNSAALTIGTGALTLLTFDSERFDTAGLHSTSSNTGRLTAPVAGVYLITATIRWAANATGIRQLYLRHNGGTLIATASLDAVSATATYTRQTITTLYYLAQNEYVEALVWQDSGGNLTIDASAAISPEFAMARIA